jgi:hypothetical protein
VIQSTGDRGIRAEGTAHVTLQAQGDLRVVGAEEGISADGEAAVALTAPRCMIEGSRRRYRWQAMRSSMRRAVGSLS